MTGAPARDAWRRLGGWWRRARPSSGRGARRPHGAGPGGGWRRGWERRLLVTAALLGLWAAGIQARLVHLQVRAHDDLVARAERQQHRTITAPAKRGEILDRHGRVLAFSVDADSIYAVPGEVGDPDRAAAALCGALARCDARERQAIADRLRRPRAFVYVRRQVSPDERQQVDALSLEGIGFLKENRRYYPSKELAAHVLGYVGIDNQGLHGIESAYDQHIRGRPGKILIQTDARRRAFSRVERPPTAGATIELSIDQVLQHIAERELRAAVRLHRAAGGTVLLQDPRTGEILALANEPSFNPNDFARADAAHRRNRAIQEIYEPGSTFKIVTASAALEEGVVQPGDPIDVSAGVIRFGSRQIEDVHRYGTLSFGDVLVKSSNVGAIKVGLRLGAERLGRYVRRFGFGVTASRDFQGQSPGIIWDPAGWSDSALASVAMGYQIGVTPLQMIAAVSAVANGGYLIEPRVVRAIVRDGVRRDLPRRVVRRAIASTTAAELTTIMEAVVERGTAQRARVPGYRVAAKTGTAAKLVDGRYSKSDYNASIAGFVPSRSPVLSLLVVIDSPRAAGYYGGAVAAPVFQRVAEAALRHLGVGPTIDPMPPVLVARRAGSFDENPAPTPVRTPALLAPRAGLDATQGLVPDVRGLSAREALQTLGRAGLSAVLDGDGVVVDQDPPPGVPLDRGATGRLRLERLPPAPPATGSEP